MYNSKVITKNKTIEKLNVDYRIWSIGFLEELATATFKDENQNIWECSFVQDGELNLLLDKEKIEELLETEERAELLHLISFHGGKNLSQKDEIISYLEDLLDKANDRSLKEKRLPILDCLVDNEYVIWDNHCWIEPRYKVTDINRNVLFDDYIGNFISGETYESICVIKRNYEDNDFINEAIKTYSKFLKLAA